MAQGKKAGLGSYRYSECGSPRPQPCQDGKRCCNKNKTAPDTLSVPLLLRVADAVGIEASKAAAIVHDVSGPEISTRRRPQAGVLVGA